MSTNSISTAAFSTEPSPLMTAAAVRYGFAPAQLCLLTDNPDDGVYGVAQGVETEKKQHFVLKCTKESVRSRSALQGQVDWVNFLAAHGAPVSRALPSLQGELVEQITVENALLSVVCYAQAPGERPEGAALTAEFFQNWGQVIGQLHDLTTHYAPCQASRGMPAWHDGVTSSRQAIPADQSRVLDKFDALVAHCQSLPTDPQSFGFIHNDLQANNLRLHRGALTVIDFDDCEQSWFISDLATALYFSLWEKPHPSQRNAAFADFVLENLLTGYRRQRPLDECWVKQIPRFLKLQEMWIYIAINQFNQIAQGGPWMPIPPKHRALLTRYRQNIEQDIPYLESAYNPWQSA